MVKTIIFDLGGVIVPFDYRRGYHALREHCSLEPDEIARRLDDSDLIAAYESGRMSSRQFHKEVCRRLDAPLSFETFCRLWSIIFLPVTTVSQALVEALRRRYRLMLLSNTNEIHFRMLHDTYPVVRLFDCRVLSHEVGAMKPQPEIYHAALKLAGAEPAECFFTDDREENVQAALGFRIDAVRFESQEQLERELRRRGVSW